MKKVIVGNTLETLKEKEEGYLKQGWKAVSHDIFIKSQECFYKFLEKDKE